MIIQDRYKRSWGPPASAGAALVWFRRDLRDFDHAALRAALGAHRGVHCVFVFDREILDALERRAARRVTFLRECVRELQVALARRGGGLHVLHGYAREEIPRLACALGVETVYASRDYEPQAVARDAEVARRLRAARIGLQTCKDQVIFEAEELRTRAGGPYSVYSPYRNAWLAKLAPADVAPHRIGALARRLAPGPADAVPSLAELGFEPLAPDIPAGMAGGARLWARFRRRLADYAAQRDYPALRATSRLSAHLRFGTVSIRALVRHAYVRRDAGAQAWLAELIWREFYFALLASRPEVTARAFRPEYDALIWESDTEAWQAWVEGRTGYPLVDAAMRELAATGAMHNRLRMITASFLVKDLGMDWRRGERHFATHLLDHDLAANNGGWQWCASTGCDAQPWFRIFNPATQSRRFDPEGDYIRRWVPELANVPRQRIHAPWQMTEREQQSAACLIGRDYPAPVVRHEDARRRTLERYAKVRGK